MLFRSPLESIRDYGTDALRLALLVGTGPGQDLRLYPEKLESCRRFANKLWNAGRYILMNLPEHTPVTPPLQVEGDTSRWLLHQIRHIVSDTQRLLEQYRLDRKSTRLNSSHSIHSRKSCGADQSHRRVCIAPTTFGYH